MAIGKPKSPNTRHNGIPITGGEIAEARAKMGGESIMVDQRPFPGAAPSATGVKALADTIHTPEVTINKKTGKPPKEDSRGIRITEKIWDEIRRIMAVQPKDKNLPKTIMTYLTAAHEAYAIKLKEDGHLSAAQYDFVTQLREDGHLPSN